MWSIVNYSGQSNRTKSHIIKPHHLLKGIACTGLFTYFVRRGEISFHIWSEVETRTSESLAKRHDR